MSSLIFTTSGASAGAAASYTVTFNSNANGNGTIPDSGGPSSWGPCAVRFEDYEGTKVVLTGDPYQIDNPYVDATSNGLSYVVERFKESPLAGHVTLRKGERSALAELAAKML